MLEAFNDMFEMSIGPMRAQTKTLTSLTLLSDLKLTGSIGQREKSLPNVTTENSETELITKLFVEILEKCNFE